MWTSLLSIVPNIIGGISDHFKGARELKKVKVEGEIALKNAITKANIEKVSKGQDHDIQWANEMAKASASSWKDEFWTIVLSIPLVMCFIPGLDVYVKEGFQALEQTPQWYQGVVLVAIGAAFGVQVWKKAKTT